MKQKSITPARCLVLGALIAAIGGCAYGYLRWELRSAESKFRKNYRDHTEFHANQTVTTITGEEYRQKYQDTRVWVEVYQPVTYAPMLAGGLIFALGLVWGLLTSEEKREEPAPEPAPD